AGSGLSMWAGSSAHGEMSRFRLDSYRGFGLPSSMAVPGVTRRVWEGDGARWGRAGEVGWGGGGREGGVAVQGGRERWAGGGAVGVAEAGGYEPEDLAFALGELAQLRGGRVGVWAGGELSDQPSGHRGGEQGIAVSHDPDCLEELAGACVLEQKPTGAGAE